MLKFIFRILFRLHGWTFDPNVPKEAQRCVMIAGPHTSNWDFYFMRLAFSLMDVPMRFTIKQEWTKFPFGLLTKPLGAIGINRSPKVPGQKRVSYIDAMVKIIEEREVIAMVIPPEGTRTLQTEWKMGFYHTAVQAGVPITFGYLDFENKRAGVGGVVYPTGNIKEDFKPINAFYKNIKGKYPEQFSLDQRYLD